MIKPHCAIHQEPVYDVPYRLYFFRYRCADEGQDIVDVRVCAGHGELLLLGFEDFFGHRTGEVNPWRGCDRCGELIDRNDGNTFFFALQQRVRGPEEFVGRTKAIYLKESRFERALTRLGYALRYLNHQTHYFSPSLCASCADSLYARCKELLPPEEVRPMYDGHPAYCRRSSAPTTA